VRPRLTARLLTISLQVTATPSEPLRELFSMEFVVRVLVVVSPKVVAVVDFEFA